MIVVLQQRHEIEDTDIQAEVTEGSEMLPDTEIGL